MIKKILNIIYVIGILNVFIMEIVFISECFESKKIEWYGLILISFAIFSTAYMLYRLVIAFNCLENIKKAIHSNIKDDAKLRYIESQMYDIDSYLSK